MFKQNIDFIGYPQHSCESFGYNSPAPLFRRHFVVKGEISSAKLMVCALGFGKFYMNGLDMTDELFISPFSDYTKTLWCKEFNIKEKLALGENVVAVALGNGFYNESLSTDWNFDKAPWRDSPKLYFCLQIDYQDSTEYVTSDSMWLCDLNCSPYRFNQLRMGEIYDYNYSTNWMKTDFDDSTWSNANVVQRPTGVMRKCFAPPIKENRIYRCCRSFKNCYGELVLDFGQNMSGYIRLRTKQPKGTSLHIIYAEQLDLDGRRKDNKLSEYFYDGETQFSDVITSENEIDWKPDFTYYGFRYVIISGFVNEIDPSEIEALFVHQDIEANGDFQCSDEFLNSLYKMARVSTLSNSFNMPTDCPTREKLGWCNDAQASCEQMVQNYDITAFYEKWIQDIKDAQKIDGDLPGIVPTGGWGYEWGSGPVSTGVLFEIPYRLYQYNGNKAVICDVYPYMLKHLHFLEGKVNPENGLIEHGLDDWAGPWDNDKCPVPLGFICTVLYIRFCNIALIAASILRMANDEYMLTQKIKRAKAIFQKNFMKADGTCCIEEQTSISLIIVNNLYIELEPLKVQLKRAIMKYDHHFHVGMLGMQYILPALDICDLNELGYILLNAEGYPSYKQWLDEGATTLHEMFGDTMSCNHHMYSCVIAWLHNTVLGIKYSANGSNKVTISPHFLKELSFASGRFKTEKGVVSIEWRKISDNEIELFLEISGNIDGKLLLKGYCIGENCKQHPLNIGKHRFILKKEICNEVCKG